MIKAIKYLLTFAVGAIAGSTATYFIIKNKTEKEIDSEVQKFKDDWINDQIRSLYFHPINDDTAEKITISASSIGSDVSGSAEKAIKSRNKPPITDYSKMYVTHAGKEMSIEDYMDKSGLIADIPKNDPRIISEIEFSEEKEYEKVYYILHPDGILSDENGDIVDYDEEGTANYLDPNIIFGFHMQNEIDELYYRNEEFGRDFEITKSARFYNEG